jgi:hypothetical protein
MTVLSWKDSPNGRGSKALGVGGEYRIGRYDTQERPWPEHGVVVPAETWFEVQLRGPNEKRGATLRGEFLVGRLVLRSMAIGPCMSSEHFGQLAWQFKRMSGSSGLKVQAVIAC